MTDTAAAQFRRIVNLLPLIADGKDYAVNDIVERAQTDRETLFADLVAISQRFDASSEFANSVQIAYDENTVSVFASRFLRPLRLNGAELAALELGLSLIRRERPPDEWGPIDRALERLRSVIAKLPSDEIRGNTRAGDLPAAGHTDTLSVLRRAMRAQRKVLITYQGSSDAQPGERVLCPYGFLFSSGAWYVVARCERVNGDRTFRADRIVTAEQTGDAFEVPSSFSLGAFVQQHRVFGGTAAPRMTVRYSPAIARWIAEREGQSLAPDGSLTMSHAVADRAWAVRHVLQYGTEAEVLEPEEIRNEVASALDRIIGDRKADST